MVRTAWDVCDQALGKKRRFTLLSCTALASTILLGSLVQALPNSAKADSTGGNGGDGGDGAGLSAPPIPPVMVDPAGPIVIATAGEYAD